MYYQRLQEILTRLRQNPMDGLSAGHLLKLRHDIAKTLLAAPPTELETLYKGDLGKAHEALLSMGVTGYPTLPHEQQLMTSVVRQVTQGQAGTVTVNMLLAGMVYKGPHQLLACEQLPMIPPWLLDGILRYVLGVPPMFKEKGEIDNYCQHLHHWVSYLHTNILSNRTSPFWLEVLRGFMNHATFITLYFSWHNLREINRQRAELIEFALESGGCEVDFMFGSRGKEAGKIRYGILAPNFVPRAETFATLPMYTYVDRQAIEVILITYAIRDKSPLDSYCTAFADRLVEIPNDLSESVTAIRELDLDAIWIGSNVTARASHVAKLSAHRLARLQLTGGCSPVSSGMRNMDVFVSGTLTEPPEGAQDHYTEKLICMNGPVICFDFGPGDGQTATQIIDRAALNIPNQAVVYASGANFFKIIPELEELWIRILATTPDSRLLLYPFNPNWMKNYPSGPFFHRISSTCKRLGVDGNRLVIIPPLAAIADIRAMLGNIADVYLDSFPHSGMTSLIDPWQAGVPTVVLEGNSQRSRMASGALRDMGIPELIANDQEAYLQLAARLGHDKDLRLRMSQRIRQQIAKPPRFLDPKWCGEEMTRVLKDQVARQ